MKMFKYPEIKSVYDILKLKKLKLPSYQRPYKWGDKNVSALLYDIEFAIKQRDEYSNFKYRVGTIILHRNKDEKKLHIVDGQQRIITLALIRKALDQKAETPILETEITSKISEENIRRNYLAIKTHIRALNSDTKKKYLKAMSSILEFVVVSTKEPEEAFQLFDSQNTRGRALDPHDLLKAFHLREMRENPDEKKQMKHTVGKWEGTDPKEIRGLFQDFLFPIKCWVERDKGHKFTLADIDEYKGVSFDSPYSYARRTDKGMPIFQIDQPFVSGKNFFIFVNHYLNLLSNVKETVKKDDFNLFLDWDGLLGVGFSYAQQLFLCAVLYYCDRFGNFDKRVIKRLYAWAFMIRLRMQKLGFDTVRNYAVGAGKDEKIANLPIFYLLHRSMNKLDVLKNRIRMLEEDDINYTHYDNKVLESIQNILSEKVE